MKNGIKSSRLGERKNPGVWRCGFRGISGKLLKWQNFINLEWFFGM
jgi:hypothetical protein